MNKLFFSFLLLGAGVMSALFLILPCEERAAKVVSLEELVEELKPNGKPLVVNHWATWCPPCIEEMGWLKKAHATYGDRVDFLGVSWELMMSERKEAYEEKRVRAFSKKNCVPFDSLLFKGSDEEMAKELNLPNLVIPQTHIYDANGNHVAFFEYLNGEKDYRALALGIEQALATN